MADDDWYRGDAWGRKDREQFEAKLARAKPDSRPGYLRIKGLGLIESKRRSRQQAGVELLERVIRDHTDAWQPEIAGAHAALGSHYERQGDLPRAVEHLRRTVELDRGTNVDHGAELQLGALLAEHPDLADDPSEAAALLAVDEASLIFRSQQFEWAVAQARLAATAGDADRAAALARGALWLEANDGPTARRHPLVGLIGSRADDVVRELEVIAHAGDAEAASPRVDEFRRPDGAVEWHWALTESLGASSVAAGGEPHDEIGDTAADARAADRAAEAADDAAYAVESRAMLAELRAAGFDDAFELNEWTGTKLRSAEEVRRAAPILLRWLREGRSYRTRSAAARGLQDRRARKLAADQVVAAYAALQDPYPPDMTPPDMATAFIRRERGALGNALATLARDAQFDQLAAMVRAAPDTGDVHLWWALAYVKDPRVVDLALEQLGDPENLDVLRALITMKTERAEPVLRQIVARPKPRTVPINRFNDDPEHDAPLWAQLHERIRIEIAEDGLAKLEKARAAGKARP